MGSSKTVRDILRKQGRFYMKKTEMKKRILPVFVLKLPHGVDSVVLNDGKQAAAHAFPEPAGGWLTDEEEKASMFSLHRQSLFESDWPSSAVVAVRTAGGQPLESVRSGLECAGRELPRGYNDYIGELVDVISAAVWGILPSHTHYSSSSRSLVQVRDGRFRLQFFLKAKTVALSRHSSLFNDTSNLYSQTFRDRI